MRAKIVFFYLFLLLLFFKFCAKIDSLEVFYTQKSPFVHFSLNNLTPNRDFQSKILQYSLEENGY